ncbi:hypothetical protein [Nitrospira sp. Ecomares 2.1]
MQERTKTEQEDRGRPDALTDLIRSGAQQLLAHALKVEVAELLAVMLPRNQATFAPCSRRYLRGLLYCKA